jgi:prepilin-type N-terminal cleavage/methylation domain-containing protein
MTRPVRSCAGAAGYTLIEMLVAIALAGIIMGPVASALFVSFRTTSDTRTSMEQSNGELLLSTYFAKDVQRAEQVSYSPTCGGAVEFKTRSSALAPAIDTIYAYATSGTDVVRRK